MTVRLPLQGRMREFVMAAAGARVMLALEPPPWQRPRGTNYGYFVTRLYVPIAYDPKTDVMTCRGDRAYWE